MSETPEENDLALEISMATFALRGHLSVIQGNAHILKLYLEERQKVDASSPSIKVSADPGMEITPQMAVQMIETILKSVHQVYQLQDELRRKASGSSEI